MSEILLGIAVFTAIVVCLALIILAARAALLPRGMVRITVNDQSPFEVPAGGRLQAVLADRGLHLPSACGGAGTCGLCRVRVLAGGGPILPVEREHIAAAAAARGERLACQVPVATDLVLKVPAALLSARRLTCLVRSNRRVAVLITELVLELPPDERLAFRAGAFVQVTAPPYSRAYVSYDLPGAFAEDWAAMGIRNLTAHSDRPVTRAYSLANHPGEDDVVMLDVRLALPPPGSPPDVPPGVVSSWLYGLAPGDEVEVEGPHGHFFADDSDREMVFIGGGAGMAPMRSHILAQLVHLGSQRRIGFWYGARSRRDLFYVETFDDLAREHQNFSWQVALSDPRPDDAWTGSTGFIHQVVHDEYLGTHPAPEDCVYYLCGPPVMVRAVRAMLGDLGVSSESIHADDFGASA